jgi:hypothetical protein
MFLFCVEKGVVMCRGLTYVPGAKSTTLWFEQKYTTAGNLWIYDGEDQLILIRVGEQ